MNKAKKTASAAKQQVAEGAVVGAVVEVIFDPPVRPDLDELLAEWQPRMMLGDWSIEVRYVNYLESRGLATVAINAKRALIQIHEPGHWAPGPFKLPPVERIFLHEMGHVQLARFDIAADDPRNVHEEQIVEAYANALYAAKYGLPR